MKTHRKFHIVQLNILENLKRRFYQNRFSSSLTNIKNGYIDWSKILPQASQLFYIQKSIGDFFSPIICFCMKNKGLNFFSKKPSFKKK